MDHAVALVQAYLQLNGYFTSAEYPIIAGAGRRTRTITDIDILAFRFPTVGPKLPRKSAKGLDVTETDPGLGIPRNSVDMIVGEVKEGRVGMNSAVRDPEVLKAVIARFGETPEDEDRVVNELLDNGTTRLPSGYTVRLVIFASFPPGAAVPPCRIISLGHVLEFLQKYVGKHWNLLRHLQFKDQAFGFLMTLEKARRGGAGRRGHGGVEVVRKDGSRRER